MNYQVLARKYRPQRFEEVVGQEHVTQTLANAIRQGRIAHAYIFCGPRGTGKTTIARIFAKCLNCTGGPKVDFDDSDPRCIEIAEGRSMDVLEIDGASNNSVDQIRDLREAVRYAPVSSKFKIYIIDEVHMLTAAAFNALLKTLEEPPPHVKFLFATTDPEKVLPTILSRCQRFDLRRIPASLIVKHLARIAESEGVIAEEAALRAIARGADGSMRDAQSTLDQLISFCGKKIIEADVLSMFGLTARDQIIALAAAICHGDVSSALQQLDELAKSGKDLGRLVADLLNHFRNLMVYLATKGDTNLLDVSEAESTALREQASFMTMDAVGRILEVFTEAEWRLRDAVSKRILLEVTLFKACQAKDSISIDVVLNRLVALRDAASGQSVASQKDNHRMTLSATPAVHSSAVKHDTEAGKWQPTASAPQTTPATATQNQASHGIRATVSVDLAELWPKLLEGVGRASPFLRSYLVKGKPVSLSEKSVVIGFDPKCADYISLIDSARNHTLIKTKLKELGVEVDHVKFQKIDETVSGEAAATVSAPDQKGTAPALPDTSNFHDDPLINKALELFRGTIVEIQN